MRAGIHALQLDDIAVGFVFGLDQGGPERVVVGEDEARREVRGGIEGLPGGADDVAAGLRFRGAFGCDEPGLFAGGVEGGGRRVVGGEGEGEGVELVGEEGDEDDSCDGDEDDSGGGCGDHG